jgi:hypothetical protein
MEVEVQPQLAGCRWFQGLKGIPEKLNLWFRSCRQYDRNDIETVGIPAKVVRSDECFRRASEYIPFPPVDEFPRLAELTGSARFNLDKNEDFFLVCDDINFTRSIPVAPGEDVEAPAHQETACDAFAFSSLQQVRCRHKRDVSHHSPLFQGK